MLPQLSPITVGRVLVSRLRHRWSTRDYPISPVPRAYRLRLPLPSRAVSLADHWLSQWVLPGTCMAGYECFKLNISLEHLMSWFYRGCWHQPCPHLSRQTLYIWQQRRFLINRTSPGPITLARIVEFSRLLHLVRLSTVSQFESRCSHSHGSYRSKPWWAVTSPTSVIGRSVVPWRSL